MAELRSVAENLKKTKHSSCFAKTLWRQQNIANVSVFREKLVTDHASVVNATFKGLFDVAEYWRMLFLTSPAGLTHIKWAKNVNLIIIAVTLGPAYLADDCRYVTGGRCGLRSSTDTHVFCRWSSCLERPSCRLARSCTERTDILRTVENVLVCLTAAHLMFKVRLINALYHYHLSTLSTANQLP